MPGEDPFFPSALVRLGVADVPHNKLKQGARPDNFFNLHPAFVAIQGEWANEANRASGGNKGEDIFDKRREGRVHNVHTLRF